MCGILGTNFNGNIVNEPGVAASLSHRGPDSSQTYTDGTVGFRISRLAIVNSDFDDQPSIGCNGRYITILNGEIYNYNELASELKKSGHSFPEVFSDAAILPHMIEEYGLEFVTKLDGMFAIAIWDGEKQELIIYRDSIGIKPIYYKISDHQIFFASEIYAIKKMINQVHEIDERAIDDFSELNLISSPDTIYQEIYSLVPGTYLRFNHQKSELKRWHRFEPNRRRVKKSIVESAATLDALLIDSISDQLKHGDSKALLLSGGLDSSIIAAVAKKRLNKDVETYHLSYESDIESKNIESIVARDVARKFDFEFREYKITSQEYFNHIDKALDSFSQPFGGVTSTYYISRYISEKHKVCLTGDGADELFGSYRNIQEAAKIYYGHGDLIGETLPKSDLSLKDFMNVGKSRKENKHDKQLRYPLETEISNFKGKTNIFDFALVESQLKLLPDQVLLFSDHLGMAHGLEIRPPFLSQAIIKFSRELPLEYLINSQGTTKYVLKELALRYFDGNFVHRKKEGFMLPLSQWMRKDEAFKWTNLKLSEYGDSTNEILNFERVQQFIEDYYTNKNNQYFKVYRLAVLMHYLKNNEK